MFLVGSFTAETVSDIVEARSSPVVLVDPRAGPQPYDAVVSDNEGGAYAAVTQLIERGHHHIALVDLHPLTTVAVDKVSMGRLAVQTLAYRLAWPDAARVQTVLRPELLRRGSVTRREALGEREEDACED